MTEIDNYNVIGRCCTNKEKYLVQFVGFPECYTVILCSTHAGKPPFNKNILKVTPLGET